MPKSAKSRAGLGETLRQFSTLKQVRKPAFIVARAEDNSPTPERQAKPDYEWCGKKRIKSNAVNALHMAGDISGEAVEAAKWWIADYVFAHNGHLDILSGALPRDYERGNVHTFAIARGRAAERISQVRERLGLCAHLRLEMLLARELSFSAMAETLYPVLGSTQGRTKASAQCALVLEQLADTYRSIRRERKQFQADAISSRIKTVVPVGKA